ncbi:MAG TPA: ABC transporter permease [Acidimicrobiia bacterium]|jgi:ABC-2 type transport system permease protein|nr:ABC transporter permease [Acidimicrobiia bacterium]
MSAALSAAGLSMRRAAGISRAFFRMGWNYSTNYPLGFWLGQVSQLLPVVIFYFISQLNVNSPAVGGDYYTFVVLGFVGMMILAPGVNGLSFELEAAMLHGHWEMLLVEPVPWRLLPFTMVVWPTGLRLLLIVVMVLVSTLLGAVYDPSGLGVALLILVLGLGTGLAIGILSSSIKVLAKKGDPVLTLYMLATQVLSGQFFNIEALPTPLRIMAYAIPQTYVNQGLRKALMPAAEAIPGFGIPASLIALAAFNLLLLPVAIWIFGRSMEYGRSIGVLSGY